MAYRSSAGDLNRPERWDRDRFFYERDRNNYGDVRERFEEDDHVYTRGGPSLRSPDRFADRRYGPRRDDDDVLVRDRRVYYDDEPRFARRSPPAEVDRRIMIERERERVRSPSPVRRPATMLRRQSSLDTFDRRPKGYFHEREEYGPPARREDFHAPANVDIPLPRKRALPPPRRYYDREFYEDIKVSDPDYYGDEEFRAYPERVREKEVVRTRRRDRSRESRVSRASRAHSRPASTIRGTSRSSSVTSASSRSSRATTVKSEYPKKGKTRIPARLVSTRALDDLGYPFVEEGNTIVVQKALGQENIDDLLKLSEDYKKADLEMFRPPPALEAPPLPPPPPPAPATVIEVAPPPPPPPAPVEVVDTTTTIIRDVSPARTSVSASTRARTPVIIDTRPREVSEEIAIGPLALVDNHHHKRDSRSIQAEIRDLEKELVRRERHDRHHHHHHDRDIVRAERLSDGQLVLYEERVEKIQEPSRGIRIEKDKKGKLSISVPKNRR